MKLIVGLGNPGDRYARTRHNLGFMAVEQFLKDFEPVKKTVWEDNASLKSDIVELDWQPRHGKLEQTVLAKPKTYMNNSGLAVREILRYKDPPAGGLSDIWVVHDDIDLPFGALRIRFGGAAAGHHGVESIMKELGTDKFWRFRLGIGIRRDHSHPVSRLRVKNAEEYVLSDFTSRERGKVKDLLKRSSNAIQTALEEGLEVAMNRFNTK